MRPALALTAWILAAAAAHAQSVSLTEILPAKDCTHIVMQTKVEGEQSFVQDGEKKSRKIQLSAEHHFCEKVLAVHDKTGLAAKTARAYEMAHKSLQLGGDRPVVNNLRADRAVAICQRSNDGPLVYSLGGALTRDELDLIGDHFDTLCLVGLLPGKEVKINETWKLGNAAVQALCSLEGLEEQELTGKLNALNGDQAIVTISGTAKGIDAGAEVALTITATATYDTAKKKIVALEWKQDELRGPGPVNPQFKGAVTVKIKRDPAVESKQLNDAALAAVPPGFDAPASLTAVQFSEPQGRFDLVYSRDWRLTGATAQQTVFRLVERGDFVSQATITPIDKAVPGQHEDPKKFKADMLASPGWQPDSILDEGTVNASQPGRFVYRISATGTTNGIDVIQTFYLIAGPNGDQVVIAFQTRQQHLPKLGRRDQDFAEGLNFPARR